MLTENTGGIPSIITSGGGGYENGGMSQWIWAFLLFALLGGDGFGRNRNNGAAGQDNTVWAAQQFTTLDNGIRGVQNGICDSSYALNNAIKDGAYSTAMAIQGVNTNIGNAVCASTYELSSAIKDCCCTTNRNIDGVNYNLATQANAVMQSGNANTQRILDYLTNKDLCEKSQALSEARITSTIMGSLQPPRPVPAYNVPSPYGSYGCNGCC